MKIKHKDLDIHPKKSVKSKNFKKHRKQGIAVQTTLNKLTNKTPLEPEPSSPIKNSPKDDFGDLFLVFGDNDPPISKHEADGKEGITVQKTPNRLTNKAPLEPEPSSPKKYSSQDDFGDHFDPSKSKHDGVTVQPEDDEDRYSEFDEDNDKSLIGKTSLFLIFGYYLFIINIYLKVIKKGIASSAYMIIMSVLLNSWDTAMGLVYQDAISNISMMII